MIRPTPEDIGRRVIYRAPHYRPGDKIEEGTLTSYNWHHAFVRYGAPDTTSAATRFADLEWSNP